MGKMGSGYGSEFHLLRYLGYHRHKLNREMEQEIGGRVIEWLDFEFGGERKLDREWKGVDFVGSAVGVKSAWLEFWPQSGNVPNWDAVGRLESESGVEYLLVEAKAHVEELRSSCSAKKGKKEAGLDETRDALKATNEGGLEKIMDAVKATIKANGFTADVEDWLRPYYQYANRLAHLHFLLQHNISARLLFIYFCGDNWNGKRLPNGKKPQCPKDAQEWDVHVKAVHKRLGLRGKSRLEERVHDLFLHV
jgi:hypothetical protein